MVKKFAFLFAAVAAWSVFPAASQEAPEQLTTSERVDCDPAVSPSGNLVAFASNRTGNYDIYVFDLRSNTTTQLTQSPKDDRSPSWSLDGRRIVFNSKRTGKGDVYEMAADGSSGYLQLTDSKAREDFPCFNPKDSSQLLFARSVKQTLPLLPADMELVVMERDGARNATVLCEGRNPRYSPDGTKLVFVSNRTKNEDIWLMDASGGVQTQLTTDPKDDADPCFSPNGKQIVFASSRTGNFDIWVMDLDGGNLRQLTTDPADETQPSWGADGRIYYTRDLGSRQKALFRMGAPR